MGFFACREAKQTTRTMKDYFRFLNILGDRLRQRRDGSPTYVYVDFSTKWWSSGGWVSRHDQANEAFLHTTTTRNK
jgi:hypothetical protein